MLMAPNPSGTSTKPLPRSRGLCKLSIPFVLAVTNHGYFAHYFEGSLHQPGADDFRSRAAADRRGRRWGALEYRRHDYSAARGNEGLYSVRAGWIGAGKSITVCD